jgi:hypothetical protein
MNNTPGSYRKRCQADNEQKITCASCLKKVHRTEFVASEGICNACYEVYEIEMNELCDKRASEREEYILANS